MTNSRPDSGASSSAAKPHSHLRLTPERILQGWQAGFYTPTGYLYYLILALRKEGWWYRIDNISQFCRQWQINRRTFYRAKAELVSEGKLEENVIGAIDLRVPHLCQIDSPVTDLALPVTDLAQPVTDLAQPVTDVTHSTPETESGQASCNPSDLSQISYRSLSSPTPHPEQERDKNEQSDPQFRDWLRERAKSLPKPPQFLEAWIDAQTQKESFQREYQASQRISERANLPPPPDRFQIETACLSAMAQQDRGYVLIRMQSLWQQGWHDLVEDLVQCYPQWGLMLTCSGVEEAEDG
jgi:hypothetical protein